MKLKLYMKQFLQRRRDADAVWLQTLNGLSNRQQKILQMNTKLQEVKQVCLMPLHHGREPASLIHDNMNGSQHH